MEEINNDKSLVCHQENRLRRLYEPLTLLSTLGETRGTRIKPNLPAEDGDGFSAGKNRRAFVDALAYICAYKKDPAYVTAAALERKPDEIVVWLATNKKVDHPVIDFVEKKVLTVINWLAQRPPSKLDDTTRRSTQSYLTGQIVQFNRAKIFTYYQMIMNTAAPALIGLLTAEEHEEPGIIEFKEWMRDTLYRDGVQLLETSMPGLAIKCYNDRGRFHVLRSLAERPRLATASEHLDKLLGKLGKHAVMSRRLVEATLLLRSELTSPLQVKAVPPYPESRIPLLEKKYNVDGISNRMFRTGSERDRFRERLSTVYPKDDLDRVLAQKHLRKKTKVHAELSIIAHFEKTGASFLDDNDKYIGCSKPACYLCYLFIFYHPGCYARPASHQKLYVNWRLPDIQIDEYLAAKRFKDQQTVLERITEHIRKDLDNDIANRTGKRAPLQDSTACGTTTVCEIDPELVGSFSTLSFEELRKMIDTDADHPSRSVDDLVTDSSSFSSGPHSFSSGCFVDPESEDEPTEDDGGVKLF